MKVDRLVSIIMILLDKERIGAQELADMFEVAPRTIYRDGNRPLPRCPLRNGQASRPCRVRDHRETLHIT